MANSKSLGTLTVDLVAQVGGWTQGLDASERKMKAFRSKIDRELKNLKREVEEGLKITAGIATGLAAGLTALTKAGLSAVDSQAKLARSVGATYDEMSALRLLAGHSGLDGLDKSLVALNQRMGEVQRGTGNAVKTFEALGISADELVKLDTTERLALLADRIKETATSSAEAAKFAKDLGFAQAEAIDFFMAGGTEIRKYTQDIKDMGLSLSEIDTTIVERATNAFSTIQKIVSGLGEHLAVDVAPLIISLEKSLTEWVKNLGGVQVITKTISATVADIANFADNTMLVVQRGVDNIFNALSAGIAGWKQLTLSAIKSVQDKINGIIQSLQVTTVGAKLLGDLPMISAVSAVDIDSARSDFADKQRKLIETIETELPIDRVKEKYDTLVKKAQEAAQDTISSNVKFGKSFTELEKGTVTVEKLGKSYSELLGMYDARQAALNDYNAALLEISKSQATQIEQTELAALAQEKYNKALEAINASEMIKSVQDTGKTYHELLGQYDSQVAKLNELERQLNEINEARITEAQKIELSQLALDQYNQSLQDGEGYWERWLTAAKNSMENLDWFVQNTVQNFTSGFGQAFEDIVMNFKSIREAGQQLFESLARSVIRAIGEMIAQQIAYGAVQKMVGKQAQRSSAVMQAANAQATALQAGLNAFASTAAIPITGPLMAPAAMAAALAATQPLAAAVKSLALTGMAHDGINSVPQTGTWLLEKGERVMTAKTSASLDALLAKLDNDRVSKDNVQVNVYNETGNDMNARSTQRMDNGRLVIDLWLDGFSRNVSGIQDVVRGG